MLKSVLTDREYNVQGNWYAPKYKLEDYPSVVNVQLCDTCSSAGDWSGFIVQKINKTSYFIPFWQSNNYPRSGYTLQTGKAAFSWEGSMSNDELYQLWDELIERGF